MTPPRDRPPQRHSPDAGDLVPVRRRRRDGEGADALLPVIEVAWGRFLFHLVLIAPFLAARGGTVVHSGRLQLQLARSALQVGSTILYFAAISVLPLATAVSIAFAQPLLVTIFSIPLLGEKVGPRRWAAVAAGFIGVVVIIRPAGFVQWAALLPLATAACSAFYAIATRLVARVDRVETSSSTRRPAASSSPAPRCRSCGTRRTSAAGC